MFIRYLLVGLDGFFRDCYVSLNSVQQGKIRPRVSALVNRSRAYASQVQVGICHLESIELLCIIFHKKTNHSPIVGHRPKTVIADKDE